MVIKPPIIAIVGPTSTGKSEIAIELADQFRGEIVSADSRQVYRGMDIGTGKVTAEQQARVPHHLLDIADPNDTYNVAQFKSAADAAIKHIQERGRLPFLVGGTGLYVQAVIDNLDIPPVPPQPKLREELEALPIENLQRRLESADPVGYENIDRRNHRRLIRAIEVSETAGVPFSELRRASEPPFDSLMVGILYEQSTLKRRIEERLDQRLQNGMLKEVEQLHKNGVDWEQLESFGLEYRRISEYLRGEHEYNEMVERLRKDILAFAKRQMTWFKRDARIVWANEPEEAEDIVSNWLTKRATEGSR